MIDLRDDQMALVRRILAEQVPECEVRAFGSRVTWTAGDNSDLDLVVIGTGKLGWQTMAGIRDAFEESILPFRVDLLDWHVIPKSFRKNILEGYEVIQNPIMRGNGDEKLIEHIKDEGVKRYGWFWGAGGEFQTARLGNFAEVQTGPFGSQLHKKDYVDVGTPIITVEHLGDNRIIHSNLPRVSDKDRLRLSKYWIQKGDIVFSRVGSVDRRAYVHEQEDGWLFSGRCLRVRVTDKNLNSRFLSFFFGLESIKEHIRQIAVGATMPSLNTSLLSNLEIIIPPLSEQRAIAHILGTLDDKIELNRRMNETLEAMARAIFKSWFVDFDPVRARGGELPFALNLPSEILNLFPDSFEDSELGEIPRGWEINSIGEVVRCVGGSTPSTKSPALWDGGTNPLVTPKDMSSLTSPIILDTARHITDAGVDKISSGRLPTGTVLLSSRAPIGYLAIAKVPVSVNQGIIAMICDKSLPNYYVLYWIEANMETIKSNAGGTTFAEISKRNFRPIQVVVPHERVLEAFIQQVGALHKQLVLNLQESNTLTFLRDLLLPKLISGELRVPDAERFIAEAGV